MPKTNLCYLCGKALREGEAISHDHVPPAQFYPKEYRQNDLVKNLLTLPVHPLCHKPFQVDEDYFVHSLAVLASEVPAGKEIWKDVGQRIRRPRNVGLTKMVLQEFSEVSPGGIYAPPGKMFKRFDGTRIRRVIWKIIRGLVFDAYDRILPEGKPYCCDIVSPGYPPPEHFNCVVDAQEHGPNPAFFAYKYTSAPQLNNFHYWALLLWDALIVLVWFHDPDCPCSNCVTSGTASVVSV